jgi:hypothetical protein
MEIIQNAVKVKDKILNSAYTHDYQEYDGVMIDGGTDYLKRSDNVDTRNDVEDLTLTVDSPKSEIVNKLVWGTRGELGILPLKWVKLKDCTTGHLEAILKNCPGIPQVYTETINFILNERRKET